MSDQERLFPNQCPRCTEGIFADDLAYDQVFDISGEDGAQTETDCPSCGVNLTIHVTFNDFLAECDFAIRRVTLCPTDADELYRAWKAGEVSL